MKRDYQFINKIFCLSIFLSVFISRVVFAQANIFTNESFGNKNMNQIKITGFDSVITPDGIELCWYASFSGTPLELDVERSLDNFQYENVEMVYGTVVDSQTVKFVYYDFNLPKGYYYYRLKSQSESGASRYSEPVFVNATNIIQPVLEQNTPNPFNPTTNIQFHLAVRNRVSLRVYNIIGQQIRTLMDGYFDRGVYDVQWHGHDNAGRDVPGGVYFYQILIGHYAETRRMILVR
ncbi:MAG: hypothetical protein ACT6FF_09500 [Methanosarcinaceae archaeon]